MADVHDQIPAGRQGLLARWGRTAARHGWFVLSGWAVGLALLAVVANAFGGSFVDAFTMPGAESQQAVDLLRERFPSQAGDAATIVFQAPAGVHDPAAQQQIEAVLTTVSGLPDVVGVVSPYQNPAAVSADGTIAYATVQYDQQATEVPQSSVDALVETVEAANSADLRVEVGGQVVAALGNEAMGNSELIGFGAAIIILLIAFGSVIAMGMPILTALAGLGAGILGITLATAVLDMSTFTPAFAAMIGIGVGIDYALFIVTRYREGLAGGLSVVDAVGEAIDTAGRAVIFAGTVVVISLLGLFVIGLPFVTALGVAAALVVGTSVLVAITLLPGLLGLVGRRIDRLRIPRLHAVDSGGRQTFSYRWSRTIQRRPVVFTLVSIAILLVLAAPVLNMRLGFTDAGSDPAGSHTRQAYDLLTEGFGPGFNGPLLVVVEQEGGLDQATLDQLSADIAATEGVVSVSPPVVNQAGDTAIITVIPSTSPQDAATPDLVHTLRNEVIPAALGGSDMQAYVGGGTAAFIDVGAQISERMPIFFGIVIGLSFLLLMAVFRSVVVPIKAALMNLISIAAAYGVLVAVFQWGWGASLIGIDRPGPIMSFLPMMLFAILFGLSMDYEVFLLSRIREDFIRSGDAHESVANGLAVTMRVITAAAAIMVTVFVSFVFGGEMEIKQFGVGLATAILVDATVVRMILVPSTMSLLGKWNWWFPSWLDRIVPKLNIEGSRAEPLAAQTAAAHGDD